MKTGVAVLLGVAAAAGVIVWYALSGRSYAQDRAAVVTKLSPVFSKVGSWFQGSVVDPQ
jgi:hypothetical protein